MPIKVTCVCGQSFAAPDTLAGKRVKCPKCAQPLQIPGAAGVASAATVPRRQAAPAQTSAQSSAGSLFDEAGLTAEAINSGPACPNCRAPLAPEAVLCVQCGFNRKLGRQMQTIVAGGGGGDAGGHAGHGDVAADLMARAARTIEEDIHAEKTKTSEGMPWYGYMALLLGVVLFLVAMQFMPQGNAIMVAAYLAAFVCYLLSLYCNICIIIIAFKEGPAQGLLYLFVPFYGLFYVITRWETCGSYFLISFGAGFVAGMALAAGSFAQGFVGEETPEEAHRSQRARYVLVENTAVEALPLLRSARG